MITVVLLNSDHPELLKDVIMPALETCDLIDEIIVSHGRKDTVFAYVGRHCDVVHRHDYGEINDTYGLSRRWLCWQQAKNDAVLSLGDTVMCWHLFIEQLYDLHKETPNIIHTLNGQSFSLNFTLSKEKCDGLVPLASGQCMLVHKRLADACLEYRDEVAKEASLSRPLWKYEDIFASLVAMKLSGELNFALRSSLTSLDNLLPETASHRPDNQAELTTASEFLRRAVAVLEMEEFLSNVPRAPLDWEATIARKSLIVACVQMGRRALREKHYIRRAKRRLDPSFILLGPERGGTSSLFYYLNQHPRMARPRHKEIRHYVFDFKFAEPLYPAPEGVLFSHLRHLRYKQNFPYRCLNQRKVTGEASPQYFYSAETPIRIKMDYPEMRFIILLRNPADRAWSLYHMYRAFNYQRSRTDRERAETFSEALRREEDYRNKGLPFIFSGARSGVLKAHLGRVINGEGGAMVGNPNTGPFVFRSNYSYMSTGVYVFWLKHWLQFFKREQFLILQSEELFAKPDEVTRRTLEFIGLDAMNNGEYGKQNVSVAPYEPMPADIRRRLNEYFEPYNNALYDLIGRRFDWS